MGFYCRYCNSPHLISSPLLLLRLTCILWSQCSRSVAFFCLPLQHSPPLSCFIIHPLPPAVHCAADNVSGRRGIGSGLCAWQSLYCISILARHRIQRNACRYFLYIEYITVSFLLQIASFFSYLQLSCWHFTRHLTRSIWVSNAKMLTFLNATCLELSSCCLFPSGCSVNYAFTMKLLATVVRRGIRFVICNLIPYLALCTSE